LIGTRLSSYEITAKLGEGGMGEVWRARDTKLERDVAIKVLPAAFVEDHERLARFEREAKLLAQLHHPNIASIFGMEESGDTKALVMELVEGPTLAERLEQGAIPVDECLSIARQVAEALEEAHDKGIIHRDLKPQNVKASREGKTKVLDFGLAKAMDPTVGASGAASASQLAASPTLTLGATQMGVVLGTAAYMAPEQAKGLAVDKRADIWAFGVVLYEMLTGARLFDAPTVPETLAQVLTRAPDLGALPASTPAAIRRLLRRCLERSPKNRLHDIADARIVIDEAMGGGGVEEMPAVAAASGARWLPWSLATLFAVVAGVALVGGRLGHEEASAARVTRTSLLMPAVGRMTQAPGTFALAPDGSAVAFLAAAETSEASAPVGRSLYVRELGDAEPHRIAGTEGAWLPFWSADSRDVGFFAGGALRRVPRGGGAVQTICAVRNFRGGAWNRDGTIVFAADPYGPLFRVSANGGTPTAATELDAAKGERSHRFPAFLPDGRHFLFGVEPWGENYRMQVKVASLDEVSAGKSLIETSGVPRISPSGELVFARDEALLAQAIDLERLEPSGAPRLLDDRPLLSGDISSLPAVELSNDGKMLYAPVDPRPIAFTWLGRDGSRTGSLVTEQGRFAFPYTIPAISHRGDRLAVVRGATDGRRSLWIFDLERGSSTRITPPELQPFSVIWSPDDRDVATQLSIGSGTSQNAPSLIRVDGGQVHRLLEPSDLWIVPGSISADGKIVVYSVLTAGNRNDLGWMSTEEDATRTTYLATDADESSPRLSPDGRWLAYLSDAAGKTEAYLDTFPIPTHARRVETGGAVFSIEFRADGKELLLGAADGDDSAIFASELQPGEEIRIGRPRKLFTLPSEAWGVAPTPMADRFLVLLPVGNRSPSLTLVENWRAQLEPNP